MVLENACLTILFSVIVLINIKLEYEFRTWFCGVIPKMSVVKLHSKSCNTIVIKFVIHTSPSKMKKKEQQKTWARNVMLYFA